MQFKTALKRAHRHIDEHFEEHLEGVREYVRQPSISADGTGIKETTERTRGFIEELGGTSKIISTEGSQMPNENIKNLA